MNNIDWQLIEVFLKVAEAGSFTAAADALDSSQPTVSRKVRELEEQLGVTLFARHARGFELTDRGAAIIESARQVEADVQTFVRRAVGMSEQLNGTVRVSASEPVAAYHLSHFLAEFLERHPTIAIELVAENRPADLARREADIGIRMFRPEQPDLVIRRAGDLPMGLFAHETYLARHPAPEHPGELSDHVLIGYDAESMGFEQLEPFGVHREDFDVRTDSLVTQFEAIRAGVGIGAAQVPVIAASPKVRRVLPELEVPSLPVWLVVHPDLRHSPLIRTVFDSLVDFFNELAAG